MLCSRWTGEFNFIIKLLEYLSIFISKSLNFEVNNSILNDESINVTCLISLSIKQKTIKIIAKYLLTQSYIDFLFLEIFLMIKIFWNLGYL